MYKTDRFLCRKDADGGNETCPIFAGFWVLTFF